MKNLAHAALSIGALVLFAGCALSQPPIGAPETLQPTSVVANVPTFLRGLSSGSDQVQYVTGAYGGDHLVEFDYPKGDSQIDQRGLGNQPTGECTKGSQTFWVVQERSDEIVEFAAGRKGTIKAIHTLTVPSEPWDCSVDPTTGNLEVALAFKSSVVIFTNASGSGQVISDKLTDTWSSAYDTHGDLFVSGAINSQPALVELPKGHAKFKELSLPSEISLLPAGFIRWDGTYLAWSYWGHGFGTGVYRLSISDDKASLEGTVALGGTEYCDWFWIWIEGGVLFCGSQGHYVTAYDYPAGGPAIAELGPMKSEAVGVVSLQP